MISAIGSFGRPERACGGIAGLLCEPGEECVIDTSVCDPAAGGRDCGGVCLPDAERLLERLERGIRSRRPDLFEDESCGGWALTPVGVGLSGAPLDTSLSSLTPDTHAWALKVIDQCSQQGVQLRVRSTLRSCAQQHELFLLGRVPVVNPKIQVTKADGCISWHVLGRAVDFDVMNPATGKPTTKDAPYGILGDVAKGLGGKWGGDFPGGWDIGHVEYHPGRTIEQACPDPQACEATQARELGGPPPGPPGEEAEPLQAGMGTPGKIILGVAVAGALFAGYRLARRP